MAAIHDMMGRMPPPSSARISLLIEDLHANYRAGVDSPANVVTRLLDAAATEDADHIWITRLSHEQAMSYVAALSGRSPEELPLYGIPFVIKDNIDLADVPTTAGCPDYAYTPPRSAAVVERLIAAGAIPLGKTSLDQFATGLVGTRSPQGACRNSFNREFISGGSSAGSAVAVASGLASFALGTDTAGSGRVPAAFNNIIGVKPSIGRVSMRGVVPACRSLDCVSIFALSCDDAGAVLEVAAGFDAHDPYSRALRHAGFGVPGIRGMRCGVPRGEQLQFFGDSEYQRLFGSAIARLAALGAEIVEIDFAPFLEAARLLYEGPWLAERYAAVGAFLETHPNSVHPVTREVIAQGKRFSAVAGFEGQYKLKELERLSQAAWSRVHVIVTPTAGTIYAIQQVLADPIRLNANLGFYTNFMNLFDLTGVAVPAGFRSDGMPFGITLVGPCTAERAVLALAGEFHRSSAPTLGALGLPLPDRIPPALPSSGEYMTVAVCGAHMTGLALNHQLLDRGGHFLGATRTAACYRLYALPGHVPTRPGLVRVQGDGRSIDVELWALPVATLGSFLAGVPAPLGLGKIELDTGERVTGFICEGYAAEGATDVSSHGSWRTYLESEP